MVPKTAIPFGLIEATRLTRAGRILEATALIQRTLRDNSARAEDLGTHVLQSDDGPSNDVFDVEVPGVTDGEPAADGLTPRLALEVGWRTPHSTVDHTTVVRGTPGHFITGSYTNHVGSRSYRLYVPSGYAGQALPLVVMLHGCTQSAEDFARGTGMNGLAEAEQCFVLYPEQTQGANPSRCWNWFKRQDQRRDRGEPAVLAGMTREVMSTYGIDGARVFIAGLSAGGAMAAVMGTTYPDLFAAVGIHSGLACGSAHDLGSALAAMRGKPVTRRGRNGSASPRHPGRPTIVFHGARDTTVHPRNGEQFASHATAHDDTNTASTERGHVPGGHAYTRTIYRESTGRVVLEHWLVHEGGHAWFGGDKSGSYVDPKGPDASREMLRFFYDSASD